MVLIRMDLVTCKHFMKSLGVQIPVGIILNSEHVDCYIDRIEYPNRANLFLVAESLEKLIHGIKMLLKEDAFDDKHYKELKIYDMKELLGGESVEHAIERIKTDNAIQLSRDVVIKSIAPETIETLV